MPQLPFEPSMRVGIISAEYPPAVGGVGDHSARLARELTALGHTVQVVTSHGPAQEGDEGGLRQTRVMRMVRRWDWRIFGSLPRLARRQAWDVMHVQYQPAAFGLHPAINLLPRWVRRDRHAPAVVTTFHDLREPYLFPKAGALRQMAVRALARGSDGLIAVAEEDLAKLAEWTVGTGLRTALEHISLGNQMDADPPTDFSPAQWRADFGIPASSFLLGHLGFANRGRALDQLLMAVSQLVGAGHDVHLLMIGEQLGASDRSNRAYLGEIERLAAAPPLDGRVHWTGYQELNEISGWLRCLDLAVLPFVRGASLRHTTLIAAWAQGLPVVTTDPARVATWLRGEAAVAATSEPTADALAGAIAALIDDPGRREQLAMRAQEFAARFAWPGVARRTVGVYRAARTLRAG